MSYNSDSTRSITFYRTKKHGREVILLHFENRSYKIRLKKGHVHLETAVGIEFWMVPVSSVVIVFVHWNMFASENCTNLFEGLFIIAYVKQSILYTV